MDISDFTWTPSTLLGLTQTPQGILAFHADSSKSMWSRWGTVKHWFQKKLRRVPLGFQSLSESIRNQLQVCFVESAKMHQISRFESIGPRPETFL